jgi:hypothetical protein
MRRALQRQWRLPLAGIALMLALGQPSAQAATITVNSSCTLIDAITAANSDTATGGCPAGHGADTLVLPPSSKHTLTSFNNSTYGYTGLPVITSPITIAGNKSTIIRDSGAPGFRILAVSSMGDLTLQETTVSGGVGSSVVNSRTDLHGGGVTNFGKLTMLNSSISGNTAYSGGGVSSSGTLTVVDSTITGNHGGLGPGGIEGSGTVTVLRSTISGNAAGGGAASGIDGSGTVTVLNSSISGNTAIDGGIAVSNNGGTFAIVDSIIADNRAGSLFVGCIGVINRDGTLSVLNSTISGNDAGGVLNSEYGTLSVLNSTISANTSYNGGGIRNYGGGTILNSTITGNAARFSGGGVFSRKYCYYGCGIPGNLTLTRTLVSGNTALTGPEIFNDGPVTADNHNLFGVDGHAGLEGFSPGSTDIVPPAGVLLPNILNPTLANNGGPTQTHALVPGSPAIDTGGADCTDATGAPLTTDQRGKPRLVDGNGDATPACDIGAFEFFPIVNNLVALASDMTTAFDPTPVPSAPAGRFTITATFTNRGETPLRFPYFGVSQLTGGNLLLNADGGPGGVGATLTPKVEGDVLAQGAEVTAQFVIGLQVREQFTFFVNVFGEPVQ